MSYIIKIYAIRSILGGNGLPQPRCCSGAGIIDEPLDALPVQPQRGAADADDPAAALRHPADLRRRSSAFRASLLEASADLGAAGLARPSCRVILPLSLPGVLIGASLHLRAGDRRLRHAADGRRHERLHLRPHRLQPVRHWPSTGRSARRLSVILMVAVLAVARGSPLARPAARRTRHDALPWYARLGLRDRGGTGAGGPLRSAAADRLPSFFDLRRGDVVWDSFGLHWLCGAVRATRASSRRLGNTLLVGAAAVVLSLVLGTLLAFWYHGPSRPRPRSCCRSSSSCRSCCRRS